MRFDRSGPLRVNVSIRAVALIAIAGLAGCGSDAPADTAVDSGVSPEAADAAAGGPTGFDWAPQAWEDCEGTGQALEAGPDDYRTVLDTLQPGDTLRLRPGTYTQGLPMRTSGEADACIVVEALDPASRPLFEGSNSFNILAIHGASWIKLRGFDIDGNGLAGFGVASQGGDEQPTHHVLIEDMDMVGLGADQQIVGISTKSPAWDWVIRGNRIVGAGTGIYLGNSNGATPFIRGVLEFNTILDTVGYSAQIKHQNPRLSLAGMPEDGAETIVRYNVFSKQNGASVGGNARPNFLLGHLPTSGVGQNDRYLVYGNFFYDNPSETLMQAEGNVAIYANVFVNPNGGALTIRPHNDVPKKIDVFWNTIIADGRGLNVSGGDQAFKQRVRYNAIYGPMPLLADDVLGGTTGSMDDAMAQLQNPTASPGAGLDLHPLSGALEADVDLTELADVLDHLNDFDRLGRDGTHAGAYGAAVSGPLVLEARSYSE